MFIGLLISTWLWLQRVNIALPNFCFCVRWLCQPEAIVAFDHIVTFPAEVRTIWKTRRTVASAIFIINRYFSLVGYIVVTYFQCVSQNTTVRSSSFMFKILHWHTLNSCSSYISLHDCTQIQPSFADSERCIKFSRFIAVLGLANQVAIVCETNFL